MIDRPASDYEWRLKLVLLPRIGAKVTRDGVMTRLILPGHYMVRRSKTLGRWIYRKS